MAQEQVPAPRNMEPPTKKRKFYLVRKSTAPKVEKISIRNVQGDEIYTHHRCFWNIARAAPPLNHTPTLHHHDNFF
ncbi:hypothetical protein M758_7G048100 [Ceratodon purpureus]|nr:hypothetical protein M758_7G047600 [Ceratodon purpureus]KAG0610221.1 hypothetical protein M758_7G048100 [Ceratodon purpureus]